MLSGTPALSRPNELFVQISLLKPRLFNSFFDFGVRYCNGKKLKYWDFSGTSNEKELNILMTELLMVRRSKINVLEDLPPKERQCIILDNVTKFREICREKNINVEKKSSSSLRKYILSLFNATAIAKTDSILYFSPILLILRQYLDFNLKGLKKFIVFCHHSHLFKSLSDFFISRGVTFISIDGTTSAEKRNSECDNFQKNPDVIAALLSITSCGFGLNLNSATVVIFTELFWNPGVIFTSSNFNKLGTTSS